MDQSNRQLSEIVNEATALFSIRITEDLDRFLNSEQERLWHLEEAVSQSMNQSIARAIERALQMRVDAVPPLCPKCQRRLQKLQKTERARRIVAGEGRVWRERGWCPKCQQWHCPADSALGIEGGYSGKVPALAALLASKMPIAEASKVSQRASEFEMAPATLDRLVKRIPESVLNEDEQLQMIDWRWLCERDHKRVALSRSHHAPVPWLHGHCTGLRRRIARRTRRGQQVQETRSGETRSSVTS